MPELVEKKEPPMITIIKKIKDILVASLFIETPILETLLVKDKNKYEKSFSKLKNTKKINSKNKKYRTKWISSLKKLILRFFINIKL